MPTPFLSSEEYDERAHQLYNEGQYDEALDVLREGLGLYPNSVELHIGVGYAHHAREDYAWARRSFEEALVLDPDHEDVELMLQIGRALFREGLIDESKQFFEIAAQQTPDAAEAVSCIGYAEHRLGNDESAISTLRRALQMDPDHTEARIYLGNIFYDRGDYEAALYHLDRSTPDDDWDELGIWRLIELKKMIYRLRDNDPELRPWEDRLRDLAGDLDDSDEMLAEIEAKFIDASQTEAKGQLELFGALLSSFADVKSTPESHRIKLDDGNTFEGTWEEIVDKMREANCLKETPKPEQDAESFIRRSADAGLLRILR